MREPLRGDGTVGVFEDASPSGANILVTAFDVSPSQLMCEVGVGPTFEQETEPSALQARVFQILEL